VNLGLFATDPDHNSRLPGDSICQIHPVPDLDACTHCLQYAANSCACQARMLRIACARSADSSSRPLGCRWAFCNPYASIGHPRQ
jgi:hypothetical protein